MTEELDPEDKYEVIGRPFDAMYPGYCTINYDHVIKRGNKVSRVRIAANPMVPVSGVVCSSCLRMLPRGK